MKKNCLSSALICVVVLASCAKHVDTEILDSGMDNSPRLIQTDNGTAIEYESWINVDRIMQTRAHEKASVTLRNEFPNGSLDLIDRPVSFLNPGPLVEVFREGEDNIGDQGYSNRHRHGDITVYDRAYDLVVYYTGMGYGHRLTYQTATYDDGFVTSELPYHAIERVEMVGEPVHTNMGVVRSEKDGKFYATRKSSHTLAAVCNGERYPFTFDVINRLEVTEPYVNGSSVVRRWITEGDDGNPVSNLELRQTLSDGTTRNKTFETSLAPFFMPLIPDGSGITVADTDIKFRSAEFSAEHAVSGSPELYLADHMFRGRLTIHYNKFDIEYDVMFSSISYDDGYISEELLPMIDADSFSVSDTMEFVRESESEKTYLFRYEITAMVGTHAVKMPGIREITIR